MGGWKKLFSRNEKFTVKQKNGGLLESKCPYKDCMVGSCTCAKCTSNVETRFEKCKAATVVCNFRKLHA